MNLFIIDNALSSCCNEMALLDKTTSIIYCVACNDECHTISQALIPFNKFIPDEYYELRNQELQRAIEQGYR